MSQDLGPIFLPFAARQSLFTTFERCFFSLCVCARVCVCRIDLQQGRDFFPWARKVTFAVESVSAPELLRFWKECEKRRKICFCPRHAWNAAYNHALRCLPRLSGNFVKGPWRMNSPPPSRQRRHQRRQRQQGRRQLCPAVRGCGRRWRLWSCRRVAREARRWLTRCELDRTSFQVSCHAPDSDCLVFACLAERGVICCFKGHNLHVRYLSPAIFPKCLLLSSCLAFLSFGFDIGSFTFLFCFDQSLFLISFPLLVSSLRLFFEVGLSQSPSLRFAFLISVVFFNASFVWQLFPCLARRCLRGIK